MPLLRRGSAILVLLAVAGCSGGGEADAPAPAASAGAEAGTVIAGAGFGPGPSVPAAFADSVTEAPAAVSPSGSYVTAADVAQAYVRSYEANDFAEVMGLACQAYVLQHGTDTSALETQLSPYTVAAEVVGDVVSPDSGASSARLDVTLTAASGAPRTVPVTIRIVQEAGGWRFCGEVAATGGP